MSEQSNPAPILFNPNLDRDAFGYWLSGFVDGEGCFMLRTQKNNQPDARFTLSLRADDGTILFQIRDYLGCGNVTEHKGRATFPGQKPSVVYQVSKISHLHKLIIPHFDLYPLRAKKARDFLIWKEAVQLMARVNRRRRVRRIGCRDGLEPKWEASERKAFIVLCQALKVQRQYETTEIIVPAVEPPEKMLFDNLE